MFQLRREDEANLQYNIIIIGLTYAFRQFSARVHFLYRTVINIQIFNRMSPPP